MVVLEVVKSGMDVLGALVAPTVALAVAPAVAVVVVVLVAASVVVVLAGAEGVNKPGAGWTV